MSGGSHEPVVLVVAKAPVPGRVKTRLGASVGMTAAADLAAAALLDTLAACRAAYDVERCHLALAGDLAGARRGEELLAAAEGWTVHPQRGEGLAERLTHAHGDVAVATDGAPVVQVGMDTPHLSPEALRSAGEALRSATDAVLGPADDGGWWLLGVGSTDLLAHLGEVPMSVATTGVETRAALERAGASVRLVASLNDVDEEPDARAVAAAAPDSAFAAAWRRVQDTVQVGPRQEVAAR